MKPIDWEQQVRLHLPDLECSPEHEAELIEELAHFLEDASRDLEFGSQAEVDIWLEREVPQWADLAEYLSAEKESARPLPLFAPSSQGPNTLGSRSAAARVMLAIDTTFSNLRYALRRLAQRPGFAATAVLSLAIHLYRLARRA